MNRNDNFITYYLLFIEVINQKYKLCINYKVLITQIKGDDMNTQSSSRKVSSMYEVQNYVLSGPPGALRFLVLKIFVMFIVG